MPLSSGPKCDCSGQPLPPALEVRSVWEGCLGGGRHWSYQVSVLPKAHIGGWERAGKPQPVHANEAAA